jgi:hypothetical protein
MNKEFVQPIGNEQALSLFALQNINANEFNHKYSIENVFFWRE